MIPTLLASGIMLYGVIQLAVALIAVVLALKWHKSQFLPGLFFLFLYTALEVIDLFFFTVVNSSFIDVAQFGFILIALLFFIAGMHPSWSRYLEWHKGSQDEQRRMAGDREVFSLLRKL